MILALLLIAGSSTTVPAEQVLWLQAKNPRNWQVVAGGAAGELRYDPAQGIFSFSAHGLAPQSDYALVRHNDNPRNGQVLAVGRSDLDGQLQFQGKWRLWSRKFWLLPVADLKLEGNRAQLKAWHPRHYLFENRRLDEDG
jgi:hypothetical protein